MSRYRLVRRLLLWLFAIAASLTVVLSLAFLLTWPIAFQKAASIGVGPDPDVDWALPSPVLDARRVIGSIPYSSTETIFEVLPSRIYDLTMLQGMGNCANKSRGLSVYLLRAGIPFHRVEVLPPDQFLRGWGHVLVRTKYEVDAEARVGLIDVLEGSTLALGRKPVDLADLRRATPFSIELAPLTPLADGHSDYYGSFLNDAVVGTTDPEETKRYFRFIEAVYVPLGEPRIERLGYNAVAVVCGAFPRTRVSEKDYARLFDGHRWVLAGAVTLLWSARLALILLPVVAAVGMVHLAARAMQRFGARGAASPSTTMAA